MKKILGLDSDRKGIDLLKSIQHKVCLKKWPSNISIMLN